MGCPCKRNKAKAATKVRNIRINGKANALSGSKVLASGRLVGPKKKQRSRI